MIKYPTMRSNQSPKIFFDQKYIDGALLFYISELSQSANITYITKCYMNNEYENNEKEQ